MPKVSIIIPVYNVELYIERCVRSVMAQTYTDIECILVDDSSLDQSMAKCERILLDYHGPISFKSLHHQHNRGLSAARNTGTEIATGEYVFYLDSDDEITPNCISLLVHETKLHPEVELVQGGVKAIPYDTWFDLGYYQHPGYIDSNDWIRYNFFKSGEELPVMAWNKLIRKDIIEANHFSFKEGIIHEDELWTLQLVKKLNKISIIGDLTYLYYKTDGSIMSTISKQRSADNMFYICRIAIRELDEPYKQIQLFKYLWILVDRIEYGFKNKEFVKAVFTSIVALIKCGYDKLAYRFMKYVLYLYTHKGHCQYNLKDEIAYRWGIETQKISNQ